MKSLNFTKNIRLVMFGVIASTSLTLGVSAQGATMAEMFDSLRQETPSAETVIIGLLDNNYELNDIASYSVANAESIGLAIAYAQAAVCLAPDEPNAQVVGQVAVDSAVEGATNAVQAGVVSALSSYASGECRALLDQRNSDSQAFAAGPGPDGSAPAAGGGAEPPPVSESQ